MIEWTRAAGRAAMASAAAVLLACAGGGTTSRVPDAPAPAPIPAQATADEPRPSQPGDLPMARQIIDRYVQAIGGRDAILRPKSSHTTGLFEVPAAGLAGQIDVYAAAPNRMLVKTNFPQLGELTSGFDGTTGWSVDPMQGPMLHEGKQLEETRVQADFYGRLHEPSDFASIETTGMADFEGKRVYVVRLVRTNGDTFDEMFDPETGLLVGRVATRETPMGVMTVTGVLSDYRKFGDQLVATRVVQRVPGQEIVVTISSVTYDDVDPAVFALPPSIEALKPD